MDPYEEYKDSGVEWIGEIPAHWEVKKLKHVITIKSGESISLDEITEDGQFEIFGGNGVMGKANKFNSESEDIIIGRVGAKCGNVRLVNGAKWISDNALVANTTENATFIAQAIETINLNDQASRSAQPLITGTLIKNNAIAIPPAEEQTAIVEYLDRKTAEIDALLSAKETLLQKLAAKRAATINDAVTKGLDAGVEMKDSGIEWLGEIPAHWEVKKLKYLVNKIGSGVTPTGGAEVYETSGIPFLRSQNIYNDGLRLDDVAFISPQVHDDMSGSKVLKGDVLLNITGASIGRCYFSDGTLEEANVNQHVSIIRPDSSKLETRFLHSLFCAEIGQLQIESLQTGANREGLTKGQLNEFNFPIPPVEEQLTIMESLSEKTAQFDELSQMLKTQIEKLRVYRQSLITEVVTGKQRVAE